MWQVDAEVAVSVNSCDPIASDTLDSAAVAGCDRVLDDTIDTSVVVDCVDTLEDCRADRSELRMKRTRGLFSI